jgi:asparagine synthase (glutamine-hydrolysing)
MCGINGGWIPCGIPREVIEASLDAMKHRGPDDYGIHEDGPIFLGNRRLSIIDLQGGHQPVFNEDRTVAAVLNGEIYNYIELAHELRSRGHVFATRSDTETLVHLYEDFGPRMCTRLRGMFAFAIWDSKNKTLLIGRDRLGKKPLYYTCPRSGGIIFASELKALRPLAVELGESWSILDQAVYDYLSLGYVPQPYTIYGNVFAVPPASWMRFQGSNLETHSYWRLDYQAKTSLPYPALLERTRELIAEAVRLRLRSDVPLGVFLSGGIDSSIVAYEAAKAVGSSLHTFSVAVEDKTLDESPVARRTAEALGVRNSILFAEATPLEDLLRVVRQYDQPFADSSAIPSFAVARLAREHVTVAFNGDGGDELFAGYRRHLAAYFSDRFGLIPKEISRIAMKLVAPWSASRRSWSGLCERLVRGLSLAGGERYLAWTMDMLTERDKRKVWVGPRMRSTEEWIESNLPNNGSDLDAQMSGDVRVNLLSDLLVKMDIATMAASLEARSPFMDHLLAEHTAQFRGQHLLGSWTTKAVLKDAYQGLLPKEVINGRKRGFEVPMESWLRNELRPLLMDTLDRPTARVHSYLSRDFVKELLEARAWGNHNWAYLVYALLVLELWLSDIH